MEPKDRIIVALDVNNIYEALNLVKKLSPYVGLFKISAEFITSIFSSLIKKRYFQLVTDELDKIRELFKNINGRVFWDGKFCDIPNIVKGVSLVVSRLNVKMFNVHASAGRKAIAEAVANKKNSLVLGVTVLTSIDETECISIFGDKPNNKVLQFAQTLSEIGADGIICSPQELKDLSGCSFFDLLLKVIPGVRPEWAAVDDQKRVMTPAEAIAVGADYLVIGRPIINPPAEIGGPVEAAKKIADEIASAQKA